LKTIERGKKEKRKKKEIKRIMTKIKKTKNDKFRLKYEIEKQKSYYRTKDKNYKLEK
jgi:hypothetical protein